VSDVDRILELNEDLYAAFESADLDQMDGLWARGELSPSVSCVHPGWPLLRGREEVMRSWAMIMANTEYIQFVITDVELSLAGDVAVLTCVENIITAGDEDEDGRSDPTTFAGAKGVATNVFRRTGDGWRLWVRHGSPVLSEGDEGEETESGSG
jgi:ketosteroid isomerase-like protein